MLAVAELDDGTAGERPLVVLTVPLGLAAPPVFRASDEGAGQRQVSEGAPQDQGCVAGSLHVLGGAHEQSRRFSSPGCAAVEGFFRRGDEELGLFTRWLLRYPRVRQ